MADLVDAELEQLDFTIVCRSRRVVMELGEIVERGNICGLTARWLVECVECGAPTYVCNQCKVRAENRMATACGSCRAQGGPAMWRFTPVGGA